MIKDNNKEREMSVRNESKMIAKHSIIYGAGNVMNRVIGFLMIPVYTRYLVPAEYGILELVGITTEIIGMILSMRIGRAMYRFYFEYDSLKEKNEVISTSILSFGAIGFLGLLLASFSSGLLSDKLLDSADLYHYFIISFAHLWFNTIFMMGLSYIQIQKKSLKYILISSIKLLIALSLNVYFIVFLNLGVMGVLLGNLTSSIVVSLILVIPILNKTGLVLSKTKLKDMLKFGLPLIPGAISNFIVLVSDRYLVKYFGSLADTGIYSLSYKFGVLPHTFITVPFFQIWSVRRFELLKSENAEEVMGKVITYFVFLLTFIGLGLSVLSKDVIVIMADSKFWESYRYIPILALSYIIFGFFNHFSMNILIAKKTKYLSYIDISNGALNVILNIILIKQYGIYGAAFATFISYTLRIIMLYLVSNRLGKIYVEFRRIFKILFGAGVVFALCNMIDIPSPWLSLCLKFFIALSFPLILFCFKFYRSDEIRILKSAIRGRRYMILSFWDSKGSFTRKS